MGCKVVRFTSKTKDEMFKTRDDLKEAGIVISTYNMMSFTGERAKETEEIVNKIKETDWGLLILDEV